MCRHVRSTSSTSESVLFIFFDKFIELTATTLLSEQEHARTTSSSNVDDRTQHEIYAHPFLRSVMAGVASVMCSYSELWSWWHFIK